MRIKGRSAVVCVLLLALAAVLAAPAVAQDGAAKKKVLRIGWAQEPQTLNPFVDQDEEDFRIWALSYDLLVGFKPADLSPAPGIAESWEVSDDRKTVTFKLVSGAKWSDGQPITSKDVKYSLETMAPHSLLFSSYVENVKSIETPDDTTVVINTTKPDARIVGGLFVYILPEHIYGKESLKSLQGSYKPTVPIVGSGPYIVSAWERGRIIRMTRNANFRGAKPNFDEIQWIKYGNTDAVERALTLGEIDIVPEVQEATFAKLSKTKNVKAVKSSSPSFTQLAFNLCTPANCNDAKFNPAVQDRTVRQAIAFAIDRNRINQIATRNTSFPGHGLLPDYYKAFYAKPADDYALDLDKANQMLDAAGYARAGGGTRAKGQTKLSFDLYVRSESQVNIQAARLVKEMAAKIGVEFKVQIVSVDKLTELTTQKKDGKPSPDFDTFIWGWGGDPYDPSTLLNLLTTSSIGASSDAFYSNPEYDRLYAEQSGEFDQAKRKQTVAQLIAISQRDLPYIVLTVDPILAAYRSDKLSNIKRTCPEPNGDIMCDEVGYTAISALAPAGAAGGDGGSDGGTSGIVYLLIALVVVAAVIAVIVLMRRRRGGSEAIELES
jgi:peptide/nickel transport system substrate-binding protein